MNESTENVKLISERQFEAEVTRASSPVVVDFYAPWCGPCKRLSPMLDELAGQVTNKVKFVKINVDDANALSQRLGIQGVPTLMFLSGGKVVDTLVGLPSSESLKTRLDLLAKLNSVATVK